MKIFRAWALFVSLVAVGALAVAVAATAAQKKPAPTLLHPGPALAALVKKAQAEGTLNFYTVPPDASVRRVVDAFTKRWGVKATWTRFGTAALQDRFGSEATAGNPGADLLLVSNSPWVGFAQQKGWIVGPGNPCGTTVAPSALTERMSSLTPELWTVTVRTAVPPVNRSALTELGAISKWGGPSVVALAMLEIGPALPNSSFAFTAKK